MEDEGLKRQGCRVRMPRTIGEDDGMRVRQVAGTTRDKGRLQLSGLLPDDLLVFRGLL